MDNFHQANQLQGQTSPLRLLSLDGGGVRGLSTIMILKHIMRGISKKRGRNVEPWEAFDMIGGTSTGGLIAVMLGRLKMSIRSCETAYLQLSERIFDPKRQPWNLHSRAKDFLLADGKFDSDVLEKAIKEILSTNIEDPEVALLQETENRCHVFVTATRAKNSELAVFRSYETTLPETLYEECKIWEACRATSAAPTFFDAIKIGPYGQEFIDGGLVHNNPIQLLHREAIAVWPDLIKDAQFVSIGTGSAPGKVFEGNLKTIVEAMKEIVTQTERTSNNFYLAHPDIVQRNGFFRFNVFHGLADIGLEEYKETAKMADATQHYLDKAEVQSKATLCIEQLSRPSQQGAAIVSRSDSRDLYGSLFFDSMNARQAGLADPSPDTLSWIFAEPGPRFIEWLQTGHGIYWINGKAGCGKSTMMKHIFNSTKTHSILNALSPKPILVGFFFYALGSELQQTFEGLLRSILLQVLTKIPSLVPFVIRIPESHAWQPKLFTWSQTTLQEAITTILQQTEIEGEICLFIDALDEYSGTEREIAGWMYSLTSTSGIGRIRFRACVSSRPRTVCGEIFRDCPALIMHQWTVDDITRYVNDSLQQHSRVGGTASEINLKETQSLTNKIVNRASGVFLWVKLVVSDLYQSLCDGSSILELHSLLEDLPDELNDMYTSILSRVDGRYLKETAYLFRLLQTTRHALTLFELAEATKVVAECIERPIGAVPWETVFSECEMMLSRIMSRCGGLLELKLPENFSFIRTISTAFERPGDTEPNMLIKIMLRHEEKEEVRIPRNGSSFLCHFQAADELGGRHFQIADVDFLHVTVKDFLAKEDTWLRFFGAGTVGPAYQRRILESLMAGEIRSLKSSKNTGPSLEGFPRGFREDCAFYAVKDEAVSGSGMAFRLLDEMDKTHTILFEKYHLKRYLTYLTSSPDIPFRSSVQRFALTYPRTYWEDDWLSFAIGAGLSSYAVARISSNPSAISSKQGRPLLHYAVRGHRPFSQTLSGMPRFRDLPVLECLLKHGSDPNLVFGGLSAWHMLLSDADYGEAHGIGLIPPKPVPRDRTILARNWWSAVCLMMRYGADMDSELPEYASSISDVPLTDANREPRKIIEQRKRFLGLVGEE